MKIPVHILIGLMEQQEKEKPQKITFRTYVSYEPNLMLRFHSIIRLLEIWCVNLFNYLVLNAE